MDERLPQIAIGPMNMAGQAFAWAEALNRTASAQAISFSAAGPVARALIPGIRLLDAPHNVVPRRRIVPEAYRALRIRQLLRNVDHVFGESFVDVDTLRPDAMILHGSEIRDPDRHMDRIPDSYFKSASREWVAQVRREVQLNASRCEDFPMFVSTPDLLLDCPTATWLPLTVDVPSWHAPTPIGLGRPVSILHIPSRRVPPIKGTDYVNRTANELVAQGLAHYISPPAVPHSMMKSLVCRADIVVDQLLTGSYGVAAVEALAAGRLVVGNVAPDVRALLPEDVPIIDATPDSLRDVLADVITNPARYRDVAARGPAYAERWHGGAQSADILLEFVNACGQR